MAGEIPGVIKFAYTDFKIFNDKNCLRWSAVCKFCAASKKDKLITDTKGVTSGFIKHLQNKHYTDYQSYEQSRSGKKYDGSVTVYFNFIDDYDDYQLVIDIALYCSCSYLWIFML